MTGNFARIATAAVLLCAGAFAQTSAAPAGKVGLISFQSVVFGSNEGQRDMQASQVKLASRTNELKALQTEIEDLQKQINTQGDKLNPEAAASLNKQLETKTKLFNRDKEDYQGEVNNQLAEIFQRIGPKVLDVAAQIAKDKGITILLDGDILQQSQALVWNAADGVDITKEVVEAYNKKSGVAAPEAKPAAPAAHKPAAK